MPDDYNLVLAIALGSAVMSAVGLFLVYGLVDGTPKDQMLQCEDWTTTDDKINHNVNFHCEVWTLADKPHGVGFNMNHCNNPKFNATSGEYQCG